eukprot:scaffold77086_cov34-Phaeocystis_antarctica.AAC.1
MLASSSGGSDARSGATWPRASHATAATVTWLGLAAVTAASMPRRARLGRALVAAAAAAAVVAAVPGAASVAGLRLRLLCARWASRQGTPARVGARVGARARARARVRVR